MAEFVLLKRRDSRWGEGRTHKTLRADDGTRLQWCTSRGIFGDGELIKVKGKPRAMVLEADDVPEELHPLCKRCWP